MLITVLKKHHHKKNFECEEAALTEYLQKQASQDIRKRLAMCYVAVDTDDNVLGYYTLTSESLGRDSIPKKYSKEVPSNYNAPVILLGRLARDSKSKGLGLGEHLLLDALFRSYRLSKESIGAMAVVVDPISEKAFTFYKKYGFEQLPDSAKMFISMKTIGQLIDS